MTPFPGMDPYLESDCHWPGFQTAFTVYAADALNARLPDGFIARITGNQYYDVPLSGNPTQPDAAGPELDRTRLASGGAKSPQRESVPLPERKVREYRDSALVIQRGRSPEPITAIELIAPEYKQPGPPRDRYLVRRSRLADSGAAIVEIDFLRAGLHVLLPPENSLAPLAPFHYVASLWEPWQWTRCEVCAWSVRDPLPSIRIPVGEDLPGATLDLNTVFAREYTAGAYRKVVDYRADPNPPLAPEDAVWADRLLREAGLRGGSGA